MHINFYLFIIYIFLVSKAIGAPTTTIKIADKDSLLPFTLVKEEPRQVGAGDTMPALRVKPRSIESIKYSEEEKPRILNKDIIRYQNTVEIDKGKTSPIECRATIPIDINGEIIINYQGQERKLSPDLSKRFETILRGDFNNMPSSSTICGDEFQCHDAADYLAYGQVQPEKRTLTYPSLLQIISKAFGKDEYGELEEFTMYNLVTPQPIDKEPEGMKCFHSVFHFINGLVYQLYRNQFGFFSTADEIIRAYDERLGAPSFLTKETTMRD